MTRDFVPGEWIRPSYINRITPDEGEVIVGGPDGPERWPVADIQADPEVIAAAVEMSPAINALVSDVAQMAKVFNVSAYPTVADAFAAANAAGHGTIYFPPGTYTPPSNAASAPYTRVFGWAITSSNVNVDLAPGAVIDGSGLGNLAAAIEVQGTRTPNVTTVTASIAAGANTITVASAAGLTVGATIAIRSSGEQYVAERGPGHYVKAEHATIKGISGTTVTLTGPVLLSYDTTTYTVSVDVFQMVENVTIRGGRIRMSAANRHYAIRAFYADNMTVSVDIDRSDETGVEFYGCRDVVARDMRIANVARPSLGYGVHFMGCVNGRAVNITGHNCRHLLDAEGGRDGMPVSVNILYSTSTAFDMTGSAFSTHAGCHSVTMQDTEAVRCAGFYIVRSPYTTLLRPKGRGIRNTGEGNPHGIGVGENSDGTGSAGTHLTVLDMDLDCTYDSSVNLTATGFFAIAPLVNAKITGTMRGFRDSGFQANGLTVRDTDIDIVVDCRKQNGVDEAFLYGVLIAPKTAANGNNQKGLRLRAEVINPKRNAVRIEGNATSADPSERIEVTLIERDLTALQPPIHMNTGFFRNVIVKDCIAPDATGLISGGSRWLVWVTPANHASGPFYFRNLVGTTMYTQGTTAYV